MNQRHLKAAIRAVGTIAGLFGIPFILMGFFLISELAAKKAFDSITMLVAALAVIPGIYLTWLLFLVWRRFSPKAVLHCCGAIAFFVLGIPSVWFDRLGQRSGQFGEIQDIWGPLAFLLWLLFVIAGYRALSRWLIRRLFQPEVSMPQTAAP
jgi:hypothetical protein